MRTTEAGAAGSSRLGQLYLLHADGALRLAYLLTGERALAEDLVQDAFVKLARRFAHLRDPDAFEAYLRRTVVNLVWSHFRHRRVERAYTSSLRSTEDTPAGSPDLAARDEIRRALRSLSERQRTAVVLRYYLDLSERRAAEVMGCRPGTVKALVHQGVEKLRGRIQHG